MLEEDMAHQRGTSGASHLSREFRASSDVTYELTKFQVQVGKAIWPHTCMRQHTT